MLGVDRYGTYVDTLRQRFNEFKSSGARAARSRGAAHANESERRALDPESGASAIGSWLDLFMMSNLVFVGCGLSLDEFPLWWALHRRARNIARISDPALRPRTLFLATRDETINGDYRHLARKPAGVELVLFDHFGALWKAVDQACVR